MSQAVYEGHRTYRLRSVGVVTTVAVAVAAVTLVVLTALYWAVKVTTDRAGATGSLETPERLERLTVLVARGLTAAQIAALALTIVWLWRARKNLDAFPDADPYLTPGWTIGAWFLPFSNMFVPGRVMANVARESSTERWVTLAARGWWIALVVSMIAYRFGPMVAQDRLGAVYAVDATAVSTYYGSLGAVDTVAAATGLVAAAAFGFTVLRISVAQEERIHRGWYEEQNRAMTAPDESVVQPVAGNER
ncbi:DUF4328 domain-containing protein [Asanoa ishikariensis]|nr:DUF4328 domain-containing protein [Asanoa ishikariensis]